MSKSMSEGISLDWSCVDWDDPEGGLVQFLPFAPLVNYSEFHSDWHGLASVSYTHLTLPTILRV